MNAEMAAPLFGLMPVWVRLVFLLWPIAVIWPLFMRNWPANRRWQTFSFLVVAGSIMVMSSRYSDAGFSSLLAPTLPLLVLLHETMSSVFQVYSRMEFIIVAGIVYPLLPFALLIWRSQKLSTTLLQRLYWLFVGLFFVPFITFLFIS